MIFFRNLIKKEGGMDWQLAHPEFIVCEVWVELLEKKELALKCNLHPQESAVVGIFFEEKNLTHKVMKCCCAAFEEEILQEMARIRRTGY